MKKQMLDFEVSANLRLHNDYCLLKLTSDKPLPEISPGQFVEVLVTDSPTTFLRRPISINFVIPSLNELWLLIRIVGDGTQRMSEYKKGEKMNLLFPLGNGFTFPETATTSKLLLVGGGVGTAPMLYLGAQLKQHGFTPIFLLGGRTKEDLLQLDEFEKYGAVYLTTEDGSIGEKGYVTDHSVLKKEPFEKIYTCGPKPMMMAVARYAHQQGISCEVSLENTMACGIGSCLCCVEETIIGNLCVCTEGPIFNINQLTWQI